MLEQTLRGASPFFISYSAGYFAKLCDDESSAHAHRAVILLTKRISLHFTSLHFTSLLWPREEQHGSFCSRSNTGEVWGDGKWRR